MSWGEGSGGLGKAVKWEMKLFVVVVELLVGWVGEDDVRYQLLIFWETGQLN